MDRRTYIGLLLISFLLVMILLWSGNSGKKNAQAQEQYAQKIEAKHAAQDIAEETTVVITTQQDSLSPLFPAMNGTR